MAKFSIIQISKENQNGTVDGYWVQNHVGTIESALAEAEKNRNANPSGNFKYAITDEFASVTPMLDGHKTDIKVITKFPN